MITDLHANLKEQLPSVDWLQEFIQEPQIKNYLQINEFENTIWYNQEALEQMLNWMQIILPIAIKDKKAINKWNQFIQLILKIEPKSEFKIKNLIDLIKKEYKNEK